MTHRGSKDLLRDKLKRIADIINTVEARCMSSDGEVTSTKAEITDAELKQIWLLASGSRG